MKVTRVDTGRVLVPSVAIQVPDQRKRPILKHSLLPRQGYHKLQVVMIDEQKHQRNNDQRERERAPVNFVHKIGT
jgi:hypothetical protein